MRRFFLYTGLLAACFLCGCFQRRGLPDLTETYNANDPRPFGGKIAHEIIRACYPENYLQTSKHPFGKEPDLYDSSSLHFCITKEFFANKEEVDAALQFVARGNTLFIAAEYMDSSFLQPLQTAMQARSPFDNLTVFADTYVRSGIFTDSARYGYFYYHFANRFDIQNAYGVKAISYNASGQANCVMIFYGKGRLLLHCEPRAFSNYFLLTRQNYKYLQGLLEIMPAAPEHIYWNEYHNHKNSSNSPRKSFSTFNEILKHPPLAAALWLAVLLLLLYILFGMKRKQRIIPVRRVNTNSSVAFTETIARLYLQRKDNKNVADKMITYFNEHIRNQYFLTEQNGSAEFIASLSRKSGISLENTTVLFQAIRQIGNSTSVNDYQLLSLNHQIQEFYKNRK